MHIDDKLKVPDTPLIKRFSHYRLGFDPSNRGSMFDNRRGLLL